MSPSSARPRGLTAAYYLRKAGHSVTVYDKMEKAGGMLQYAIPNYRLPKHYVDEVAEAIKGMGVDFEMGKELGRDFDAESLERRFDKVFYATGAWKRRCWASTARSSRSSAWSSWSRSTSG